jgi:hypothetical protein
VIGRELFFYVVGEPGGFIFSVVCAILLLLLYRLFVNKRTV